eukprot:1645912-Rhodomonas_salina.3
MTQNRYTRTVGTSDLGVCLQFGCGTGIKMSTTSCSSDSPRLSLCSVRICHWSCAMRGRSTDLAYTASKPRYAMRCTGIRYWPYATRRPVSELAYRAIILATRYTTSGTDKDNACGTELAYAATRPLLIACLVAFTVPFLPA